MATVAVKTVSDSVIVLDESVANTVAPAVAPNALNIAPLATLVAGHIILTAPSAPELKVAPPAPPP